MYVLAGCVCWVSLLVVAVCLVAANKKKGER